LTRFCSEVSSLSDTSNISSNDRNCICRPESANPARNLGAYRQPCSFMDWRPPKISVWDISGTMGSKAPRIRRLHNARYLYLLASTKVNNMRSLWDKIPGFTEQLYPKSSGSWRFRKWNAQALDPARVCHHARPKKIYILFVGA
jgi:hypothetical protein